MTKNMAVGESVYGEKRIAVEDEAGKVEYRVWNPFRSKLAAAVLGGVDKIHMPPGSKVCRFFKPRYKIVTNNSLSRFCILELPAEPQLAMCQISLAPKVQFIVLNNHHL